MSARPTRQSAQQAFSALGSSQEESECSQQLRLRALTRLYFIRTFQPFGPAGARINFPFQCAAVRKMSSSVKGLQLCVKCNHIAWVRTRPAVLVQHTVSKPAVAISSNAMLIWKGLLSSSVAFTFVFVQIQKAPNIAALTNTMLIHRNCLRFQYHLDFSPDMSLLWYVVKSLLSLLTKTRFSNYMWWGRSILWHHSCAIGKTFGAILKLERKGF